MAFRSLGCPGTHVSPTLEQRRQPLELAGYSHLTLIFLQRSQALLRSKNADQGRRVSCGIDPSIKVSAHVPPAAAIRIVLSAAVPVLVLCLCGLKYDLNGALVGPAAVAAAARSRGGRL